MIGWSVSVGERWKEVMVKTNGIKSMESAMTPGASITFRKIQIRYSEDYLSFVNAMIRRVGKDHSGFLMSVREIIQSVIADLGKLVTGKAQKDAQNKLVKRVIKNIELIDSQLEDFKKSQVNNNKMARAVENSEKKTGVAFDELTKDQEFIKAGLKNTEPKGSGFINTLRGMAPQAYSTGEDITKGLAQAVLGPFAGIAQAVGQAGTGIYKGVRDKRIKKKEDQFSRALRPVSTKLTPGIREEIAALEKSGTPIGTLIKPGGLAPDMVTSQPSQSTVSDSVTAPITSAPAMSKVARPVGATPVADMKQKTVKDLARPLEFFFDKLAYKAKWTSDLLREVKKLNKENGSSGGGFWSGLLGGGLMGSLKRMAPILASVLLGAGLLTGAAALTGIGLLADKLLRKAVPKEFHKFLDTVDPREWATHWKKNFRNVADMAYGLTQSVRDMAGSAKGIFKTSFKSVKDAAVSSFKGIVDGVKSMGVSVMGLTKKLGKFLSKAFAGIEEMFEPLSEIGKVITERFTGFFDRFKSAFSKGSVVVPIQDTPKQVSVSGAPARVVSSKTDDRVVSSVAALVDKIDKLLSSLPLQTASAGGTGTMSKPAVDDVYSTRDPLLGALNSGGLGVSG